MNKLLRKPIGILASLVMVLTMLILPQAALAKVFLSNGDEPSSGGGGSEGDPLDSNDYSGGDGGGSVHQRRVVPRGIDLIPFDTGAFHGIILLRVEFIGDIPVFSLYIADSPQAQPEAGHGR